MRKLSTEAVDKAGNGKGKPRSTRLPLAVILAVIWLVSLSPATLAQTPRLTVGAVTGGAGGTVDLPVTFTAGATDVSAVQFDLTFPSALSYLSVTTGSAAAAASKSASASAISGGARVLLFGLNQTAIGSGSIATVRLDIADGATPGALAVGITGIVASDPDGAAVATNGSGGSVTVSGAQTSDTTPPVISGVATSSITASSAVILWTSNEPSDTQVEFGATAAYGRSTSLGQDLVTSHSAMLSDLQAVTLYHYRVKSRDAAGNLAVSGDRTFTSQVAGSDLTFTQITLSNLSETSVTINWTTNKPSAGTIQYGSTSLDQSGSDSLVVTTHATHLTGLLPSTLYQYRITAADASSHNVTSDLLSFKTSDQLHQPARPSEEAIFILSIVENSGFRTNLGINNLSSSVANVTLTLVDKQGMVLADKTVQVDPQGLRQINSVGSFLAEGSLGNDIQGSLYLESDQPVYAWASQIENTTNDPSLLLSKPTGTTKILIPSAANTSAFTSSLVVMNLGTVTAQVALKAYSVGGAVLGETTTPLSISPNGLLRFENILQTLGVTNNYGPVEITALNSVPLVASSRVSSTSKTGGFFEGLKYSDASVTQIIPNIVDNSQLRTNIGINNVADQGATVMIRLINQDGVEVAASPVTVAAKGLTQINNVARQFLNQSAVSNFEGYVRLESNQPIFGWASIIDNVTNDPGFAVSRGAGASPPVSPVHSQCWQFQIQPCGH